MTVQKVACEISTTRLNKWRRSVLGGVEGSLPPMKIRAAPMAAEGPEMPMTLFVSYEVLLSFVCSATVSVLASKLPQHCFLTEQAGRKYLGRTMWDKEMRDTRCGRSHVGEPKWDKDERCGIEDRRADIFRSASRTYRTAPSVIIPKRIRTCP